MRKNQILAAALLCLTMQGHAQTPTKGGGISSEMLTQIERNGVQSSDRVISNALATNKIDDLALNFKEQGRLDTYFSVETPAQSIHNQKSSGRCWLFSGLNVLRANFARLHKDSIRVEYSQVYLSFYDQLEKANLMLQGVIDCADKPIDDQRVQFFFKNPLNDGGTFCGAADLAREVWCRADGGHAGALLRREHLAYGGADLLKVARVWFGAAQDGGCQEVEARHPRPARLRCSARSITC